ncbi:SDR family oxidoreductase [Micromonospora peucetia]|uniref:3-oxoacyl-[acyl-carrier-protein] reductase n=1 Tax=Micromonospora peucetia TaxID=47871 RepID=A0A1C6VXT2_9ACTN|nr:SDR family NAD(P)-dependent oxidoreductase [Micromonospora peucetia]MCX4387892.1 SDR family oxidoreductase [Micromonospora peucetia]WSA31400.1 SDR family oxidoreductase [Micromonospora peucetia]SCL70710.1 3-oxoacyl-[acyl-carrier-protein] reductase [Micromonospora peucetia]
MSAGGRPVALVTGGSRGIGRAVVQQLVRDGYDVAMCYQSSKDAADEVVAEAALAGGRVLAMMVDVADPAAVREFVSTAERELGDADAVVSVAGIIRDKPLALMSDADWRSVMEVNLDGTYHLCRAVVRRMMRRRAGAIVTVSSVSGVAGNPMQTNYSASKAGVIGFTKALAKEVGRYGIRANVVAPGYIDTDMIAALSGELGAIARDRVALGRLGRSEEIAEVVSFLLSSRASYLTGQVITVDGGLSM